MKSVGIVGGLGPETTAKFYLEIVSDFTKKNQTARPPILMWSIPLPLNIEEDLIIKAQGEERYIPFLLDAVKRLAGGGADFIVIPCNSVHIFIEEVRKAVNIPVLSIVEETVGFLQNHNVVEVGILATSTTIKSELYTKQLNLNGIKTFLPDEKQQIKIGNIIFNLVNNKYTDSDEQEIQQILNHFETLGVKTVILACTDLQLLNLTHSNLQIFDTMKILVDSTINKLLP